MSTQSGFRCRIGLLLVLAAVCGCAPARRGTLVTVAQIKEELRRPHTAAEREAILRPRALSYVDEMATVEGLRPETVVGYGLVTGLAGTGSDKRAVSSDVRGEVRKSLIREETRTMKESWDMLQGRDSSIVEVVGAIPAGAAYGDKFDVVLRVLDSSTSLEGGYLHVTPLATFQRSGEGAIRGDTVARAQGQVTAAAPEEGSVLGAPAQGRTGVVFGGGSFERERVLLVRLKEKYTSPSRAVLIEYLLNRRFANVGLKPGDSPVTYAAALSDRTIQLRVPGVYRKFVTRFADVVRALRGSYYYGAPDGTELERLERKLEAGEPEEKYEASVALEAVGLAAAEYLERAAGDDWTVLYSGQALAYLNSALGRTRIIAASESSIEEVRYEAVRFLSNLAGRSAIQALRAKVFDPSNRISIEAIEGLVGQGAEYADKLRLADFDIVAIAGMDPGLIVKTTGRPMIVVRGTGARLEGRIEVRVGDIGIGSTDASHVGIVSGLTPQPQEITVEATADSILAALARLGATFETARKVVTVLEDAGNFPYEVTWMD